MVFEVKHRSFQGPLEVLLDLIEARKLHIGDVALAQVTDDFLDYVRGFSDFPVAESAQFAYVAATLLFIKSRALLPDMVLSREEEQSIEDLERRLRTLQRFRELSRHVRLRFGKARMHLPRARDIFVVFAPPAGVTSATLREAACAALAAIPKAEVLQKVAIKRVISLEEMIENLKERVTRALKMSFAEFSGGSKAERVNVIVGFLAMLELVKQGLIFVEQAEPRGDITMETGSVATPRY